MISAGLVPWLVAIPLSWHSFVLLGDLRAFVVNLPSPSASQRSAGGEIERRMSMGCHWHLASAEVGTRSTLRTGDTPVAPVRSAF